MGWGGKRSGEEGLTNLGAGFVEALCALFVAGLDSRPVQCWDLRFWRGRRALITGRVSSGVVEVGWRRVDKGCWGGFEENDG